jgi:alanine racemase
VHDIEARPARRVQTAQPNAPRVRKSPARAIPAGATGIITIDLAQVRANWQALARHVAPAECAAVVKADAYGLGAARVIPALFAAGCRTFFVATLDEAASAKQLAPAAAIYVLDGLLPETAHDLVHLRAIPVLASLGDVRAWASLTNDTTGAPLAAIHMDTGLNRLGMSATEVRQLAGEADVVRKLHVALLMSHLACADEADHPMNAEQLDTFKQHLASLPPARASLAASDGLLLGKAFHFDLVRPGYALYGGQATRERSTPVAPVVRVSARILQVQDVARGDRVGYSASYRARSPRRIATIAAGYADGVFRHASSSDETTGGAVSIRGARVPFVGRVSMDLITVDVTDIPGPPPERGDWVDLVGPDLTIEDVGAAAGTIGYEVLTRLGDRFHRVYLDQGD